MNQRSLLFSVLVILIISVTSGTAFSAPPLRKECLHPDPDSKAKGLPCEEGVQRSSLDNPKSVVTPVINSPSGKGVKTSEAPSPKLDLKGSIAPEYSNNRPRQSLGAVESQRVGYLSGKELWKNNENFTIHNLLELPDWVTLSLEERVRYEDYSTPWRGGGPTSAVKALPVGTTKTKNGVTTTTFKAGKAGSKGSLTGQYSVPIQTVVFAEARWTDQFRTGFEFWDARQYGGPDSYYYAPGSHSPTYITANGQRIPDSITSSTVDTGQFAQIYAAWTQRNIFRSTFDSETKGGQMTMGIGSQRLIGRAAFRNTQQQYVGVQQRIRSQNGEDEILGFVNDPLLNEPGSTYSGNYNTSQLVGNNVVWNRPSQNTYFLGSIWTHKVTPGITSEIYTYYLNESPETILNRNLVTPGFRLVSPSRKGEFNFELEAIGQAGNSRIKTSKWNPYAATVGQLGFSPVIGDTVNTNSGLMAGQNVASIYQHIHVGYTFNTDFDPRLTAQWDYGSSHFDTLYGPTVYEFGPTGIGGFFSSRTNINSPGWKFEFIPHRDVTVYLNQRWWWMADATSTAGWQSAGIYNPANHVNYQGSYIGETFEANARWDAHYNLAFQAGWQVLMKGDLASYGTGAPGVVCNTSGKAITSCSGGNTSNVNYFYVQTEIRL